MKHTTPTIHTTHTHYGIATKEHGPEFTMYGDLEQALKAARTLLSMLAYTRLSS